MIIDKELLKHVVNRAIPPEGLISAPKDHELRLAKTFNERFSVGNGMTGETLIEFAREQAPEIFANGREATAAECASRINHAADFLNSQQPVNAQGKATNGTSMLKVFYSPGSRTYVVMTGLEHLAYSYAPARVARAAELAILRQDLSLAGARHELRQLPAAAQKEIEQRYSKDREDISAVINWGRQSDGHKSLRELTDGETAHGNGNAKLKNKES